MISRFRHNTNSLRLPYCLLLTVLLAAGCGHGRVGLTESPQIAIQDSGLVLFKGEAVTVDELPQALRKGNVTREQSLNIRYLSDAGKRLIPAVTASLRQAGYRRIMFTGPRKSSATVGPEDRREQAFPGK